MAQSKGMTVQERIEAAIKEAIVSHAETEKERLITEAVAQFERSVRERVGTVAISLSEMYNVERLMGDLVIRVKIGVEQ